MNHWKFKYLLAGAGGLNWYYATLKFNVSALQIPFAITTAGAYIASPYFYFKFSSLGTEATFTACPYSFGQGDIQFLFSSHLNANWLQAWFLVFNNEDDGTGGTEDRSRGMLDFNRRINSQTNAPNRARQDHLYNVDIFVNETAPAYGELSFVPSLLQSEYVSSTTMIFTNTEQRESVASAYGDRFKPWSYIQSANYVESGYTGVFPPYITPNDV